MAELNHPLNDSTAVLIDTVLYEMGINDFNEVFDLLTLDLRAHYYKNLLDHMISIKVKGTLFDAVV